MQLSEQAHPKSVGQDNRLETQAGCVTHEFLLQKSVFALKAFK